MFISELANIYSKKPYLNEIISYIDISPKIEQFIIQEVRYGATNLNPYRFSYLFAYDPKDVINLFIAFSTTDGPLKRLYRYDCADCNETNILNDEQLKNFKCYECGSPGNIETIDFLEDVRVIFEIKEPYLKDVKKRLKDQASSNVKMKTRLEGANKSNVNLKDIIEANKSNPKIQDESVKDLEKAIMQKISFGLSALQ